MKLTDVLKRKLEGVDSAEEKSSILGEAKEGAERAGVIIDDDEIEKVAGGSRPLPP